MPPKFEIGYRFRLRGDVYQVIRFEGGIAILQSAQGAHSAEKISGILTDETYERLDSVAWTDERGAQFIEEIPEVHMKAAKATAAHLLEAITGYRSGTSADAKPDEPRNEYDPRLHSLTQRFEHKAKELGVTRRSLFQKRKDYERNGLYGLVDQRTLRLKKSGIDARVMHAVQAVLQGIADKSNVTNNTIRRHSEAKLNELYPGEDVPFPSESAFNRFFKEFKKKHGYFGSAKGRRNASNRPETPYSHFRASRPGEMILIDSTPLDAFAMDPYSFQWVMIQLTISIDLCTRSIIAWRFTPVSTKAVDAAMLLWDILRPKAQRDGWPDDLRYAYVGVPESIIMEVGDDAPGSGLTAIPFLHPDSVIVDRGKVFISNAFSSACNYLGINLYIARPYTPTDKAHVERVFKTIRENFVESLPGYKGPDVYSRGLNVEDETYYFIDEIEEKFARWVAQYWQRRHHDGLELPYVPTLNISPNDAYEEGIARAGFVYAVPDQNTYFELLPTEWRTIQHYGIDLKGLRYDGEILDDFRATKSPYLGENAGKWPIRFDDRDRSHVYFYDPVVGRWHALKWTGNYEEPRPFNEKTISFAKARLIRNGGNENNSEAMRRELNKLLDEMDARALAGAKERRLAAVRLMTAQAAAADRPKEAFQVAPDSASPLLPTPGITLGTEGNAEPNRSVNADDLEALPSAAELAEDYDDDF